MTLGEYAAKHNGQVFVTVSDLKHFRMSVSYENAKQWQDAPGEEVPNGSWASSMPWNKDGRYVLYAVKMGNK